MAEWLGLLTLDYEVQVCIPQELDFSACMAFYCTEPVEYIGMIIEKAPIILCSCSLQLMCTPK